MTLCTVPCKKKLDFLGFFIQNANSSYGRKLPKCYVKSTNFSSIAHTNVGNFSMSFGCKIFNGSEVMSLQIWNYEKKSILVWKFAFSNLMACNSRTIGNFATKTHGEATHISVSNWGKIGGFNITFRYFSTLTSYPILYEKPPKFGLFAKALYFRLAKKSTRIDTSVSCLVDLCSLAKVITADR